MVGNLRNILREDKSAQRVAVIESIGTYGLHTAAHRDARHHIVVVESIAANGLAGVGDDHRCIALVVLVEGISLDCLHIGRNVDILQLIVIGKAAIADICYAVRQRSPLQALATVEGIFLQTGDTGRNRYLTDTRVIEGIATYLRYTRRNVDIRQTQVCALVLCHRIFADSGRTLGQRKALQRRHIVEHIVTHYIVFGFPWTVPGIDRSVSVLRYAPLIILVTAGNDAGIAQI